MTGSANSRRFQLKSSLKKNDGLKAKRRTSSVNSRSGTISSGGAVSRLLTEKERMATVIQFVSTALDSQLKKVIAAYMNFSVNFILNFELLGFYRAILRFTRSW